MAKSPRSPAKKPPPGAASEAAIEEPPIEEPPIEEPPIEEPAIEEPPIEPAPRRSRVMPWLIAMAAVAGLGLLVWVNLAGPNSESISGAEDPAAAAMERRLAAIEQRLTAIEAGLDSEREARSDAAAILDVLAAKLDTLDRRMADIEARPTPVAREPADLGPLEDRLAALEEARGADRFDASGAGGAADALEQRIAALEQAAEAARIEASDALEDRIAALEARPIAENTGPLPVATLLAVAQLRAALRGSGPYDAALAALEAVGGGDDDVDNGISVALAVLAPHAAAGIPTPERLRDRFSSLAEAILRAAVAPPGGSWIGRTLARLSGLVTVRRVGGDVAGDTAEAIVARAEARLATGDLAAAVGEVEGLAGAPAEAAASWLADARARIQAEGALAALDARTIAAMGGG